MIVGLAFTGYCGTADMINFHDLIFGKCLRTPHLTDC